MYEGIIKSKQAAGCLKEEPPLRRGGGFFCVVRSEVVSIMQGYLCKKCDAATIRFHYIILFTWSPNLGCFLKGVVFPVG
jgi:hypothetical protein